MTPAQKACVRELGEFEDLRDALEEADFGKKPETAVWRAGKVAGAWKDLYSRLDRFVRAFGAGQPDSERKAEGVRLDREPVRERDRLGSSLDGRRADALAEVLALRAARDPDLKEFRREFLGESVLGHAGAAAFLGSPALCALSADQLRELGLSAVACKSREAEEDPIPEGAVGCWVALREADPEAAACTLEILLDAGPARRLLVGPTLPVGFLVTTVETADGGLWRRETPVLVGSVMAHLLWVASVLAARYSWNQPWAQLVEVAYFVFTGVAPAFPLAVARSGSIPGYDRPTVELLAPAWVSPETAALAWAKERRNAVGEQRAIREKTLGLVLFVEREWAQGHAEWEDLRVRWNVSHPCERCAAGERPRDARSGSDGHRCPQFHFRESMNREYRSGAEALGIPPLSSSGNWRSGKKGATA